jgi:hypothetical protein
MIDEYFESKSIIEWKKLFKTGIQINLNMIKEKQNDIPNFNEDIYNISNEVYTALKGKTISNTDYWQLPKLRKENLFVESPLNTTHQQNMYDFIYDQQDIYDYYDDIFDAGRIMSIKVRKEELPLAETLKEFYYVLNNEFTDEKDMYMLANIRWYENSINMDMGDKKMFDEDIQSSIFSTTFTERIMEDLQLRNNSILSLLNSIILSITFFCSITHSYIMKYSNNEHLFVDCYIKRVILDLYSIKHM